MDLATYLFKNKITNTSIADAVGCHRMTIGYITTGKGWPRKSLALKIVEFTNGEVTLKDLMRGKPDNCKVCPACGQRRRILAKKKRKQLDMFTK